MLAKILAGSIVVLILLPFTAPFSTCDVAVLLADSPATGVATLAAGPAASAAAVGVRHLSLAADDVAPSLVLEDDTQDAILPAPARSASLIGVDDTAGVTPAFAPRAARPAALPLRL